MPAVDDGDDLRANVYFMAQSGLSSGARLGTDERQWETAQRPGTSGEGARAFPKAEVVGGSDGRKERRMSDPTRAVRMSRQQRCWRWKRSRRERRAKMTAIERSNERRGNEM
ncbi:hypothetical protein PENSPDRAFT_362518 [Peniophora sp. CONT]|nr:hypothetical protein PENSPDRAFT_362518 [Peniophora sp. CONT]